MGDEPVAVVLPSEQLLESIDDPSLRLLIEDVLRRNPRLARVRAEAAAVERRAPQVKALPDPMAGLTIFLLEPQTRVGPQQAAVSLSQKFPWFGKLRLREQAELFNAAAAQARTESMRLELITEVRRLYYELAFLEDQDRIVREDRATLEHYELLAQARYASGVGLGQSVIKIQAEITRADTRLLDIAIRRSNLVASTNTLRDRPDPTAISVGKLADISVRTLKGVESFEIDFDVLRRNAIERRPELIEADARIESAATRIDLAKKDYSPDVTLGLNYGFVGRRTDGPGQVNPPPDNGDDILGLIGAVNIPIWREKLRAGVEEAVERRISAEEMRRSVIADIDGALGDLMARISLLYDQIGLYDDVLVVQAEQSLLSAEAAYAAGSLDSLDLLDAERVLLNVRIAAERVRADHAIAVAKLEGEIAAPLTAVQ
ncbi:MAG: TolC family protein [Thermoanaerobaculales bacterium]